MLQADVLVHVEKKREISAVSRTVSTLATQFNFHGVKLVCMLYRIQDTAPIKTVHSRTVQARRVQVRLHSHSLYCMVVPYYVTSAWFVLFQLLKWPRARWVCALPTAEVAPCEVRVAQPSASALLTSAHVITLEHDLLGKRAQATGVGDGGSVGSRLLPGAHATRGAQSPFVRL